MATVAVIDLKTGDLCDVFAVYCRVLRIRYSDGVDFSYLVKGKNRLEDFSIEEVIINIFKDPGEAMDLVDRLDAMLHDEKKELPPEKMII